MTPLHSVTSVLELTVSEPPAVPRDNAGGGRTRWLPVLGLLAGAAVMVAVGVGGAGPSPQHPALLAFPVIMIVSMLTSLAYGVGGAGNAKLDRDRDDYLSYLGRIGGELREAAVRQQDRSRDRHPDPAALWTSAGTALMWRCRAGEPGYGRVRVGRGEIGPEVRPVRAGGVAAASSITMGDPVTHTALDRFLEAHAVLPDMAVTIDLLAADVVAVAGERDGARALARALLCQLAVSHGPDQVRVAVVAGATTRGHWDWVKWLPHNGDPPMFFEVLTDLGAAPRDGARLLVVLDHACATLGARPSGATVLAVGGAEGADLHLTVTPTEVTVRGRENRTAAPDLMLAAQALACARRLARHHLGASPRAGTGWLHLLGLTGLEALDAEALWRGDNPRELRVPLGSAESGRPVELDIREAAAGGMGPHGLCIGATGSGKSELLRTVAVGMIAVHPPEELNLILVDFKGGATFLDLHRARHVSAIITNLADEAYLVDRMQDALTGEINRRQRMLREAGNVGGIADYRRARAAGRPLPPLPTLLVIVDEFAELLGQHPEFVDVFVAIGRLGRSLGIHLLLASQRLDEGRLRGLESHLSYRICLKTLSAGESRAVLGVADAYELPTAPGGAFLKVGASDPLRFQAALVSAAVPSAPPRPAPVNAPVEFAGVPSLPDRPPVEAPSTATLLDAVLDAVADHGAPAHPVWLPPLPHSPSLDEVLSQAAVEDLRIPVGLADRVFEQRREPTLVELSGAAGNVAVIGAPQSGKSAALRTLCLALAATHPPERIQLYCLDFGGGLGPLRQLPHVGAIACRRDVELVRRTVADLTALLRRREALFTRHGLDSMAAYRHHRATGVDDTEDPFGDVFLIVDGWAALRQEYEELEQAITMIAAEGLSLGLHVVLAAGRWADLRPALRDQIGTRIELRLADPIDSEIDRRAARNVPAGRPGRGLTPEGNALTVALPRLDGCASATGLAEATAAAANALRDRYPDRQAPPIRVLPHLVDHAALAATPRSGTQVVIGVDEHRLGAVTLDFDVQPHLLILGDRGSGKTSALRMIAAQIDRRHRLIVVDPRRTMTAVPGATHVSGGADLVAVIEDLLLLLHRRTTAADHGPAVFVLVDDYDVATGTAEGALTRLTEILPLARDVGLHLLIARPAAGAGRALYEPLLAAVRHSDAMGLQLSAGADEGPLLASSRPAVLPPGRAVLITRAGGEQCIQVAWSAP